MAVEVLQQWLNVNNTKPDDYKPMVNEVVTITAGRKPQIAKTSSGIYRAGSVSYSPIESAIYEEVFTLWQLCKDLSTGCLYWDRGANEFSDDYIGTGDGTNRVFQLRTQRSAGSDSVYRIIQAPIHNFSTRVVVDGLTDPRDTLDGLANTIILTDNGVDVDYSTYDIDELTGIATFHMGHAPVAGHVIRVRTGYFFNCVIFPDSVWPKNTQDNNSYIQGLRIEEIDRLVA
jgi:hypothetical protein